MDDYRAANDRSRAELDELAGRLGDDDFERTAEGGWTVGMLFGHLAFWERYLERRWRHAVDHGLVEPMPLPAEIPDFINDANEAVLRHVPGRAVATEALMAAESIDRLLAGLPAKSADAVFAAGRPRLLDRSLHRLEHLDQIRQALGR